MKPEIEFTVRARLFCTECNRYLACDKRFTQHSFIYTNVTDIAKTEAAFATGQLLDDANNRGWIERGDHVICGRCRDKDT